MNTPYTSAAGVFSSGYTYSIVSIMVTQGNTDPTVYDNSDNKFAITPSTGAITFDDNVSSYTTKYQVNVFVSRTLSDGLYYSYNYNTFTVNPVSCFNYGTKFLCLNQHFEEEYIPIQELKRGSIVKTYLHGYRRIDCIGRNRMLNDPTNKTSCMFKMEKTDSNANYASQATQKRGDHVDFGSGLGDYRPDGTGQDKNSFSSYGKYGGYMKKGGSANYNEGDEVYMTEEDIKNFRANGGQIEYI
jgi:hypothetical protein